MGITETTLSAAESNSIITTICTTIARTTTITIAIAKTIAMQWRKTAEKQYEQSKTPLSMKRKAKQQKNNKINRIKTTIVSDVAGA